MNVIRKIGIKTLLTCMKSDMCRVAYNSNTYPGFHYDAYLGTQQKNKAALDAIKTASKRWGIIERGNFLMMI